MYHSITLIWTFEESVFHLRLQFTLLVAHIFASHAIAGSNCSAGIDRAYYGMKLKSEICGREFCKPATAKTRRIPIAGNTESDRGIVEKTSMPVAE